MEQVSRNGVQAWAPVAKTFWNFGPLEAAKIIIPNFPKLQKILALQGDMCHAGMDNKMIHPWILDDFGVSIISQLAGGSNIFYFSISVVPHKGVAEVSKIGNR